MCNKASNCRFLPNEYSNKIYFKGENLAHFALQGGRDTVLFH